MTRQVRRAMARAEAKRQHAVDYWQGRVDAQQARKSRGRSKPKKREDWPGQPCIRWIRTNHQVGVFRP